MLAQGIRHTEKDSHRVDKEQIPLTYAACNPEGSAGSKRSSQWQMRAAERNDK